MSTATSLRSCFLLLRRAVWLSIVRTKVAPPHASVPGNPLLAEALYLTKYIERMGTGTGDMIERCRKAGLPSPEFALTDGFVTTVRRRPELAYRTVAAGGGGAGEVTGEVQRVMLVLVGEMKRTEIQSALRLRHEDYFREAYLTPALRSGIVEMTIPGRPRSSRQKYRLTATGRGFGAKLGARGRAEPGKSPGKSRGKSQGKSRN